MNTAAELVAKAKLILLDFDGPVCSVFAGIPAPQVAGRLRDVIRRAGHPIPDAIATEADPLEVLTFAATLGDSAVLLRVEDSFRAAEVLAARSSSPTPYAAEFIQHVAASSRPLVIVSNNSEPAITAYLDRHDLTSLVTMIVGRSYGRPDRMKPSPWPLEQVSTTISVPLTEATLVGDSPTDVQAAHRVGALCVGYANRPGKAPSLGEAGADAIITTMRALVD